jgi:hypothetical protein
VSFTSSTKKHHRAEVSVAYSNSWLKTADFATVGLVQVQNKFSIMKNIFMQSRLILRTGANTETKIYTKLTKLGAGWNGTIPLHIVLDDNDGGKLILMGTHVTQDVLPNNQMLKCLDI